MVRALIERQMKLGRVIRGLNCIGNEYIEATEIVTTAKDVIETITANEALAKANIKNKTRRNILGPHLSQCNPHWKVWEEQKEMTPQQQASRTVNILRKLTFRWYQCAQRRTKL